MVKRQKEGLAGRMREVQNHLKNGNIQKYPLP